MNPDLAWKLHPRVAVRPESFGALLYHFGTRRLSFVKDRVLLAIVEGLEGSANARAACVAAGVPGAQQGPYLRALTTLAASHMIEERVA